MTNAKHPRILLLLAVIVAVALAAIAITSLFTREVLAQTASSTGPQRMAVPSYFYPGSLWTQMEQANPTVGTAVINPNSGSGDTINQDYVNQVKKSQEAGLTVLGYVHTSYGARDATIVKNEIDRYYEWYKVDGIFLDEAEYRDCSDETYYKYIFDYVRSKDSANSTVLAGEGPTSRKNHVVQNPGTQTQECYMKSADIMLNFEGTYNTYSSSYSAPNPNWLPNYDAKRFWHLIYSTPNTKAIEKAVKLSKTRNAGWVYVTPDALPNPWDTLPQGTYWNKELSALKAAA